MGGLRRRFLGRGGGEEEQMRVKSYLSHWMSGEGTEGYGTFDFAKAVRLPREKQKRGISRSITSHFVDHKAEYKFFLIMSKQLKRFDFGAA